MIHARNFARLVPGARVAAISDPVAEVRAAARTELGEVAEYESYRDLLQDKGCAPS